MNAIHTTAINDFIFSDNEMMFDEDYKLRLSSKKLKSGKCQVKFFAQLENRKDMYGYVLVSSEQTLRDVVTGIKEKLNTISQTRDFYQLHLFSIGKTCKDDLNFLIFES
ncbi:MAG: hypothetical protein ACI9A7_001888 [Cyclobacteriaceae bacterium]|jgi:hypothetical protein